MPLDAVVTGSFSCNAQAPQFVDDLGQAVAADLEVAGNGFKLKPKAPLQANRTYTVTFPTHQTCGNSSDKATFSTSATPGFRYVGFAGYQGELMGASVHLSEPVANPADLAKDSTWISSQVAGYALAPQLQLASAGAATSFDLYYKNNAQRPALTAQLTVTLRQGLKFASGAVLAKDLQLHVIPANLQLGWWATGPKQLCAPTGGIGDALGCEASRAGSAALDTWPLPILLLAVWLYRRRQTAA